MPVLRYFLYVGGTLLLLLFALSASLPKLPTEEAARTDRVEPVIRIQSDRKLPARVVFDTSIPTIVPPAVATVILPAAVPAATPARDAFAKAEPSDLKAKVAAAELRKPEARPQPKRRVARAHVGRQMTYRVAQQPRFAPFGNMFGYNMFGGRTWTW